MCEYFKGFPRGESVTARLHVPAINYRTGERFRGADSKYMLINAGEREPDAVGIVGVCGTVKDRVQAITSTCKLEMCENDGKGCGRKGQLDCEKYR